MVDMFDVGITVTIPSAIVLGGDSEDKNQKEVVRFSESNDRGLCASFQIGKRVFDAKYTDGAHYNNFLVYAYGDIAERVKRLSLKSGSCVHIWAKMDLTPDIFKVASTGLDESAPGYAHSRWNKGIRLQLIAIDYAGGGQKVAPKNPSNAPQTHNETEGISCPSASDNISDRSDSDNNGKPSTDGKAKVPPVESSKEAPKANPTAPSQHNESSENQKKAETFIGDKEPAPADVEIVDLDSGVDIFRKSRRFFG